jgi:hypothetical protein
MIDERGRYWDHRGFEARLTWTEFIRSAALTWLSHGWPVGSRKGVEFLKARSPDRHFFRSVRS